MVLSLLLKYCEESNLSAVNPGLLADNLGTPEKGL
jgi:hypothetical protein